MWTTENAASRLVELEGIFKVRPNSLVCADLASCYFTLGETEKALPFALKAWEKNKHPDIGTHLALILKDLGRHNESVKVLEESYHLNPDNFYTRMGYGEGLLKAGLWKQAWPIYDNSRPTQQGAACDLRLPNTIKEWQGQDLTKDETLLVINEGGAGDRISYARWLPELTKRGINWKFYPYSELFEFFVRIFPKENLVADGEDLAPDPTHWVTTFSLPAKLNVGPTDIPSPLPLSSSKEAAEKYKIPRPDSLPVIGLCYEAAEQNQGGRRFRSLSEGQAMRLVCMTGDKIHWVNLQHGASMPHPVSNIDFRTWDDTAGLIENLDAVVTVDTSIMHLAGAMNKPTAVLLPANSCWKFLRTGKKLPLYPSAIFYRNPTRGFEDAITELVFDIRKGCWPPKSL
jgi:tetratricopeptide (TPR) repeat protein